MSQKNSKEASLDNKLEALIVGNWNLLKDIWILIIAKLKTFSLVHKHLLFHLLHFATSNYFNQIFIFSDWKSLMRAKGMSHLTWKLKNRRVCTMQITIYMKIVLNTGFFIDVKNLFSAPLIRAFQTWNKEITWKR